MKYIIFKLAFFSVFLAGAQNIEVSDSILIFPATTEVNAVSVDLEIYNPGNFTIEIVDIDLFKVYGNKPFNVSDTAFILFPSDTHTISVSFLPEHNIMHEMALIIKTNSGFGHKAVLLNAQGQYSNNYYSSTQNLSEEALKTALSNRLAQGYNSLGYNSARDHMFMNIDNKKANGQGASVNTLEGVYTGTIITGYSSRSAAQNGSPQFNTEHTFPQGKFNSNEPMKSDLYHLFPTTNTANSQRGNDPFGVVNNPSWSVGGSKSGGGVFEPRDVQKGPSARAMMYFVIRYQDYQNFFAPQENILRSWHNQFPPDQIEKKRNDDIAQLQNNRNPFIDYPQLEERITSFIGNSMAPAVRDLVISDDTINLRLDAGRYVYEFVVYNSGNQQVNLSNFSLTDTSLKFMPGFSSSLSLEPGEARHIRILFDASLGYTAQLEFDTDVPGHLHKVIPIRSGVSASTVEFAAPKLSIYPNPAKGVVNIESDIAIKGTKLINLNGQILVADEDERMELTEITTGVYFIVIEFMDGTKEVRKIILQ